MHSRMRITLRQQRVESNFCPPSGLLENVQSGIMTKAKQCLLTLISSPPPAWRIVVACLWASLLLRVTAAAEASDHVRYVEVGLASAVLRVSCHADMSLPATADATEAGIHDFFHGLLEARYQPLLKDLEGKKDSLQLNDWMYYYLLRGTVDALWPWAEPLPRELAAWFLMSMSGFDTRLAFDEQGAELYLWVEEPLYDLPMLRLYGRTYYHIPVPLRYPVLAQSRYVHPLAPMPGGRALSLDWTQKPLLPVQPQARTVSFRTRDSLYALSVLTDASWVQLLAQQPIREESAYFSMPMSPILYQSLMPQLERIMQNKDLRARLEVLLALTRSAFVYREDEACLGRNWPMAPDEVFFYPCSDCEDRAALFYQLAKELLGLPMAVISFSDHVTIGVATPWPCRDYAIWQGRQYCICDPTGPIHSAQIGTWPPGYENRPFQVMLAWQPER